jgi:plasmid stabilization system protein ParE
MGYEVRLTAKARVDLNEIIAYIAQDNPLAAERLGDELAAQAGSLSNYRYRGGLMRRCRNSTAGSWLLLDHLPNL